MSTDDDDLHMQSGHKLGVPEDLCQTYLATHSMSAWAHKSRQALCVLKVQALFCVSMLYYNAVMTASIKYLWRLKEC